MRQIEPPPSETSPDEVDLLNARVIQIGPLSKITNAVVTAKSVWELTWVEEDAVRWRSLLRALKQLVDGSSTAPEKEEVDEIGRALRAIQTCSSDMLSFTVPPSICKQGAFFVRVRFGIDSTLVFNNFDWTQDGIADERGWINPLTWRNGDHFAPKFRRQMEYLTRTDKLEALPPPPVVFNDTWEAAHIVEVNREAAKNYIEVCSRHHPPLSCYIGPSLPSLLHPAVFLMGRRH